MTDRKRVSIQSPLIVNIYCRNSPPPALLIPNFKSDNGSIVLSIAQVQSIAMNLLVILCAFPILDLEACFVAMSTKFCC